MLMVSAVPGGGGVWAGRGTWAPACVAEDRDQRGEGPALCPLTSLPPWSGWQDPAARLGWLCLPRASAAWRGFASGFERLPVPVSGLVTALTLLAATVLATECERTWPQGWC